MRLSVAGLPSSQSLNVGIHLVGFSATGPRSQKRFIPNPSERSQKPNPNCWRHCGRRCGRGRPVGSMGVASAKKEAKISPMNLTNQIIQSRSATLEIPLQWKPRGKVRLVTWHFSVAVAGRRDRDRYRINGCLPPPFLYQNLALSFVQRINSSALLAHSITNENGVLRREFPVQYLSLC